MQMVVESLVWRWIGNKIVFKVVLYNTGYKALVSGHISTDKEDGIFCFS